MVFIVQDAKARRACEEKRCCASAHLVPVRRRRVAKDDRVLLNLDRLHLCKQRAPSGVSAASLSPSECGERHEARLAERSEAELAKVFDRIVKGCWMPATKLGLGRRKSHHPFSLPRCECIVSGCWRRTVHVVLPSDGEHISQLHATQLRVDGCDNTAQTQPSEERASIGSEVGSEV